MFAEKKPKRAVTRAELLTWFRLERYTPPALPSGPAAWVPMVTARAHLLIWLKHDHQDQVLAQFEKLKADPTCDLGFDFLGSRGATRFDRPSVRMISKPMLDGMVFEASGLEFGDGDSFDEAFGRRQDNFAPGRFAHLRVDLAATKAQLKVDFDRWLDDYMGIGGVTHRSYNKKLISRWIDLKFLPFADLYIFTTASGLRLPPKVALEILGIADEKALPRDSLRSQFRALEEIFSHDTATALHLVAGKTKRLAASSSKVGC